ncbi:hypothetical protein PILCRDRAFT_384823 [Piloderma croceum F 1598]|uniref:non-specific serine/threonine protein kinase n=1 Tax=Piloderma croceum (strain F 1598) TaxID=765440 RepID=A0A0C3BDU1_PILCF|nr:hypothetical protein PILCRDRAFT_384823 [Piloderma croceum F 1598]
MSLTTSVEEWRLRADVQVGEGTFGRVYKATRVSTDSHQIVALKKSRASLSLKSTLLNHERLLLQLLHDHPSIPKVIAYGRLKHFEYLAMEFLGMALNDVHSSLPAVNILVIADQMISALKHVHKNDLVHCDVKPGNILLHPTDSKCLYLVDYGLSRAIVSSTQTSSKDTPSYHVVGTLPYASLNMHYGIRPAPRDDIESLGYSLLHLAIGNLPWMYNVRHGTKKTQHDQVRIKKQLHSGAYLAPDGLSCIGKMIDHARSLKFNQLPNYELLSSQIRETSERAGLLDSSAVDWNIPADASFDDRSPCPVPNDPTFALRPGQIICCQINARTTLEGYSARAGDPSFWRDPSLSPDTWNTVIRPAIVLQVEIDKSTKLWTVKVICIGRGTLTSTDANMVSISSSPTNGSVTPSPAWPLSDSYCYAFPRPQKFFCYPGEVQPITSPWTLSTADVDLLRQKFDNEIFAQTLPSSESVHYYEPLFAKVTALVRDPKHGNAEGEPIEWGGRRAWFDERAALARRHREHERGGIELNAIDDPLDSYWEWDFERWENCQGELSSSVTAGVDDRAELTRLPPLPMIVDVEASNDVLFQASIT